VDHPVQEPAPLPLAVDDVLETQLDAEHHFTHHVPQGGRVRLLPDFRQAVQQADSSVHPVVEFRHGG
jgi:hypothetical protein